MSTAGRTLIARSSGSSGPHRPLATDSEDKKKEKKWSGRWHGPCGDGFEFQREDRGGSPSFWEPGKVRDGGTIFWECWVLGMLWTRTVDLCFHPRDRRLETLSWLWAWLSEVAPGAEAFLYPFTCFLAFFPFEKLVSWFGILKYKNFVGKVRLLFSQRVGKGRVSFRAQTFTFCQVQWNRIRWSHEVWDWASTL